MAKKNEGERPGMMVYFSILEPLEVLSMEQRGKLFTAMLLHGKSGIPPDFSDDSLLELAWRFVRSMIDTDAKRYEEVRDSRRYSKYCGDLKNSGVLPLELEEWRGIGSPTAKAYLASIDERARTSISCDEKNIRAHSSPNTDTVTYPDTKTVTESVGVSNPPPTLQEVTGYCQEAGLKIDTQRFYDHYTAVGWMVGKSPVADWKALCRRWAGEDAKRASKGGLEVDYGEDQFFSS